ncbi:eukaryotic translation initiation factor 2-alpha kinase 1, partial [Oncorhynchus masou masou]|uniref:eukaryotic translation initiation factor 2-alpha kinase 1 n=1 Tax=Oncorhynchus masou masou TaxID=90313 RepID=UPI003183FBDB
TGVFYTDNKFKQVPLIQVTSGGQRSLLKKKLQRQTPITTEVLMAGKQYPSIQEFTNQLLLGSLLEHLCFVYERDPTRSHMLFKVIGQHLAAKNVLSLLTISEEFSTIRFQYNRGFTELLHAVSTSIVSQGQMLLNTDTQSLTLSRDPYGAVDMKQTLSILHKILKGVEYIHSRGIMHRDLKPRNIFMLGHNCHVKIGDFGLACRDKMMDDKEKPPSTSQNTGSSHTAGVGTFVYAAPEQLEGSHYDSNSDMYSIGVVAQELFQPFGTEMERVQTLGDLRKGKVPDSFSQRWPVLAKYITLLTSRDPTLRPSATQLLQSELFSSKDMVIHGLQTRVEEQKYEIVQLRRQISQLQTQSMQQASHSTDRT